MLQLSKAEKELETAKTQVNKVNIGEVITLFGSFFVHHFDCSFLSLKVQPIFSEEKKKFIKQLD